jgi:hypothetical protein
MAVIASEVNAVCIERCSGYFTAGGRTEYAMDGCPHRCYADCSGSFRNIFSVPYGLTLSNSIFLPPAYSPALTYFGRERDWWVTWNYLTVLKEKNRNRKCTTCAICWLKSVLHEEKRLEQENHFPVPDFSQQIVQVVLFHNVG